LYWRNHLAAKSQKVALRVGDWKIIGSDNLETFTLFNIRQDPKETTDRSASAPAVFSRMKKQLVEHDRAVLADGPDWWKNEKRPRKKTKKTRPELAPIRDVTGLPRVLLIGDSISIGYTLPVRALLKGKANVHRPAANCGPTTRGLEHIDAWLGDGRWDVIHFNWGLHDLKYMGPRGENLYDPAKGRQQVPLSDYKENLEKLVQRLKKTGASLVWRNTTPVPPGARGRVVGDSKIYNDAALEVMQRHGVRVQDLYGFVMPRMKELMKPADVHFTTEGSRRLAERVADQIEAALAEQWPVEGKP
jgi:acyl-CoA thioesterase-1